MSLVDGLLKILPPERVKTRLIDRLSYASDAGFYHLVPQAVVQPQTESEVADLFTISHQFHCPLVFRTGGSSLSGQSITDGILVDLSIYWRKAVVENGGSTVRVQPGITGAMVNAYLKYFKTKIGPDPSSISTAMMGGILSNNASGMCCGVKDNSYHTLRHIRFILPGGESYSTENREDYDRFMSASSALASELLAIRNELLSNENLFQKIRRKYKTKNTVGYSLNAFIDHEHPLDIFAHLLVGAEGTLAFIAEAVMNTVPDPPFKSTALLYFAGIVDACAAIQPLIDAGAEMVELMDRASLRSVEHMKGIDPLLKTLPPGAAALLIEFQELSESDLEIKVNKFLGDCHQLALLNLPVFTNDPAEREFLWKVRKGMFPAVGAVRASGTTVILEDVAFPLATLGLAILDLQSLFEKYAYHNAIIFGHAKDGNIHFVVTQSFDGAGEVERYDRFLREVVTLVVEKYDGTLKAEHGTGRNMAPFVETEWGGDAYRIMKRIKKAADPMNLLNPGVIINEDPNVHIRNLKDLPAVEEEVDKCIECGYCEHKCPSRDITMTPRRRIVIRRSLAKLKKDGAHTEYKTLLKQYQYDGLETCAVDGLCATACPVDINTGDLVKRLRRENHSGFSNKLALIVAKNFGLVERMARFGLSAGTVINKIAGRKAMTRLTRGIRKIVPAFPLWTDQLGSPPSVKVLKHHRDAKTDLPKILYFPGCISRLLGEGKGEEKSLMSVFISVAEKTGFEVLVSKDIMGSCCGQIFSSKGFGKAYQHTANRIVTQLWEATNNGEIPVVLDVSSCTYTLAQIRPVLTGEHQALYDRLKIMDSIDFLHDVVLPLQLPVQAKGRVVLHPVCTLQKTGTEFKLRKIAARFANEVVVPASAGCCGMAGDRGFLFPELTQSATAEEAASVRAEKFDGYYSSTKTCEMAMSEAVGQNYQSILYLADKAIS